MSYWRMKRRVEKYKAALGKKPKEVTDELIELERQINILKGEIEDMKRREEPAAVIAEKVLDLGVLETRYRTAVKQFDLQK